jgi:ribosomal protein S17
MIGSSIMVARRGVKGVDIGDVDDLLKKGKEIRKKYKALKKRCDDLKSGEAVTAQEIRKLADELKKAIDEAHSDA